jgi:N-acyl-D-aspartate/D-glutamate deacylase
VSFLQLQSFQAPDLWKELLDAAWEARADGANLVAQVANRPFGMLLGLTNRHPFTARPSYVAAKERAGSLDELVAELAKPEVKAAILSEEDSVANGDAFDTMGQLPVRLAQMCFTLDDDVDYEPTADKSVAARAEAVGQSVEEFVYDTMLEAGGKRMFVLPFFNYAKGDHDDIYAMLTHPASVPGLGDGGAHLATICDASMPTYQLSHWVKGRTRGQRLSLEAAVKMQTHDTAALYGLGDRGTLEAGKRADLNVIDLDALKLLQPRVEHDLPADGARLLQDAEGYRYTIVGGEVTRKDDADTGARPGRLVRGAR